MKKILNWKYAFFCIYTLCSLALISGVDNTYAAGNPFESNIKTDPTALVLGDVVDGSGTSYVMVNAVGKISTLNSTSTLLGAGEVFTGSAEDTKDQAVILITSFSDVASATDGLDVQWSADGITWIGSSSYTVAAGDYFPISEQTTNQYFRVIYTNGSSDQTVFSLQTKLSSTYSKPSSHKLSDGDNLTGEDDAELVISSIVAPTPDGSYSSFRATRQGNFPVAIAEYGDTPSIDAFDRLRVSNAITIFDSKQLHDKQPLFWDEVIGSGATSIHSTVNAATRMTVNANAADYVIRQTKQRFNYQPGKSQLILFTFYGQQESGLTKRVGLFDGTGVNNLTPNNGIFFETDGDISWNIAKNGTITEEKNQESWNYDKLDGTGPSGETLDMDATQIGIIDYEWLGVGRVRVGFVIDGIIRYCHYFNHSNDPTFTSVYMSTPNLPLRYSIQTDGTAGGSFDHICSTVMSEGGVEETGVLRSVNTGTTHVDADAANTTYAVVGIKLKSDYIDVTVLPEFFSMMSETADDFRWTLHLNPTVSGTFTYSDIENSAIQGAVGATANVITDDGLVIDSGFAATSFNSGGGADRKFVTALRMGSTIDGTIDEIVLSVTPLTAGADIQGSLTFRELL